MRWTVSTPGGTDDKRTADAWDDCSWAGARWAGRAYRIEHGGTEKADFVVVNMVAEAASGSKSPKEAAERAQKRAERYYKV